MAYPGDCATADAAQWRATGPEPAGSAVRADTYRMLARLLYAPPQASALEALCGLQIEAQDTPLTQAWRALAAAAAQARPAAVDDEFHRLFIGLGRGELLPYGSWYLAGALMDRPLLRLRQDLLRLGLVRDAAVHEPEDHAPALLQAMALLAEDPGCPPGRAKAFAQAHVLSWMPRFFQELADAPSARFYRAVAALGAAFLDFERRWLDLPAEAGAFVPVAAPAATALGGERT